MKKIIFVVFFAFLALGFAGAAQAEVNVNLNFGFPAVVQEPPAMIIITPGVSYAYIGFDAYFYGGYMWSIRGDHWYRASRNNGRWGNWVMVKDVPGSLRNAPKNSGKYRNDYNAKISSKNQGRGNEDRGNKGRGNKGRGGKH